MDALSQAFTERRAYFYHKPGFANGWFSDVVYVFDDDGSRAWIVALMGYPGRHALDDAARVIGELMVSGELAAAPWVPGEERSK